MQEQVNESKKSFDATISKIADNIKSELHLNAPLFIAIMNPETQCLHYIGKSYYYEILTVWPYSSRITKAVNDAKKIVDENSQLNSWYKKEDKTEDIFIDLLFNTPISRYYRLFGRAYNAGSPVFFYTNEQFELYKGASDYIKNDPIFDKNSQEAFGDIIDELEKVFFEKLCPANGMMTPICLYGQIIGAVFLGDNSEKKFNYYDYLRLLQIIKESAVTLIKDAMEFEFLSAVLKDMLGSGLLSSILRNLPKLFCISGACMKDANDNCSQLIFKKDDNSFPKWEILQCDHNNITSCAFAKCSACDRGEKHAHSNISSDICNNHKGSLLDLKSGIHIVNKDLNIIVYFSSESDVLETHKRGINLAFDDALELLFVEEEVKREIAKHALRAAIAAIMSRNMSHNIGSHVLARISSKGINGFPESENTGNIVKGLQKDESKAKEVILWGRDIRILSQYLQQRQDFIAQIATEWPEWTYPAWLMKDIMRWFLSQKHLLNYIGSSEDLCAHFYGCQEGSNPDCESKFPVRFHVLRSCKEIWDKSIWENGTQNKMGVELWKTKIEEHCSGGACSKDGCAVKGNCSAGDASKLILLFTSKDHTCCCPDEDIQVAIPGGIIGYHAFYTILENVIRNGAKHSFTRMKDYDKTDEDRLSLAFGQKENGKRDVHFDVIIEFLDESDVLPPDHKDNNSYRFRVYDNVSFVTEQDINELENCLYYPKLDRTQVGIKFNPLKQKDYDKLEDLLETIDALKDKNGEEAEFNILRTVINNGVIDKEDAKKLQTGYENLQNKTDMLKKKGLISNATDLKEGKNLEELHDTLKALYEHLIVRMNHYFRQNIITESGELKKGNWGLGEMKISVGYLQQKEIRLIGMGGNKVTDNQEEKTDGSKEEGFIIRATVSPLGTLAFEFRVPKPKEVGMVCK